MERVGFAFKVNQRGGIHGKLQSPSSQHSCTLVFGHIWSGGSLIIGDLLVRVTRRLLLLVWITGDDSPLIAILGVCPGFDGLFINLGVWSEVFRNLLWFVKGVIGLILAVTGSRTNASVARKQTRWDSPNALDLPPIITVVGHDSQSGEMTEFAMEINREAHDGQGTDSERVDRLTSGAF